MNILCYGDSNTYGYDPRGYLGGYYEMPWPRILAEIPHWNVRNLGENGREIPVFPVSFPEESDLLIVMLGTNDLLQGNSAEAVAQRMESFLTCICLDRSKILMIAPPSMKSGAWVSSTSLIASSTELVQRYQSLSQRLGVRFVNADKWNIPIAFDGVHFTEEGHKAFGTALINYLKKENGHAGNWNESPGVYFI